MLETDKLEVSPNDVLSADTAFETPADNALARSTKPPGPGLFEALAWCLGMQVAHLIGGVLTIIVIAVFLLVGRGPQVVNHDVNEFSNGVADQDVNKDVDQVANQQDAIKELLTDIPKSYVFPLISGEMLVFVAITLVACWWRIGRPLSRRIGFTPIPSRQLVLMLAGIVPLLLFCGSLHQAYAESFRELAKLMPVLHTFDGLDTNENLKDFGVGVPLWALLLVIAVAPAVGEEFIFRGLLSRGLIARYGLVIGVAITSVLFAMVHLHPAHAAAVLPMGVYIHVCYLSSRSCVAPLLVHFLNNAIAAAIINLTPRIAGGELDLGELPGEKSMPFAAMLGSGGIALMTITAIWKSRVRYVVPGQGEWSPGYPSVELPPEDVGAVVVCDKCPPALFHIAVFLGMFVTSFFAFGICKALTK